jgi:hypothetical protein
MFGADMAETQTAIAVTVVVVLLLRWRLGRWYMSPGSWSRLCEEDRTPGHRHGRPSCDSCDAYQSAFGVCEVTDDKADR